MKTVSKDELLKSVQKFKFDQKLFDLGVYSRQYLSNILFWKYSEFNKDINIDDYSVIFGDFNKLSAINRKFSDEAGDQAIYNAMALIKDNLPKNAKIARVAGDEIIAIIENCSKEEANTCIANIHNALGSPLNDPYGLTITLAASHSSEKSGIEEMYEETENKVNNEKLVSKNSSDSQDKVKILKEKISSDFENYFSLFRFSDEYNLSLKNLKSVMKRTLNSIISVIEFDEISTIEQTPLELKGSTLNKLRAKLIDDELSKENVSSSSLSETILTQVLDSLLREPISNQYSRRCLDQCLETISNESHAHSKQYNAIQFSTSFLKLSNSISGHIKTDKEIRALSDSLYDELNKYVQFDDAMLCENPKNMLLDVGGADFLAIFDKDTQISPEEIEALLENVNSNSTVLKLSSYISKEPISKVEISSFLKESSLNSKSVKDKIKEDKIKDEQSQQALDLLLADCLVYYKENFKTSPSLSTDTMSGKVKFMNLMFSELLSSSYKVFDLEKMKENNSPNEKVINFPDQSPNSKNVSSVDNDEFAR